jgi:hypothetical protein
MDEFQRNLRENSEKVPRHLHEFSQMSRKHTEMSPKHVETRPNVVQTRPNVLEMFGKCRGKSQQLEDKSLHMLL